MGSKLLSSGAICAPVLLLAWAAPSVAAAQQAAPQPAASSRSDEIVVTARKRAESIREVPASLTVVGASEATARGAVRVRDLEAATPNVLFTGSENNSLTRVSVRGLESQARQNVGTESGLGVYVDGVVQGRLTSFNQELPDLERVEFLRGPQGTLYGRNSIMGAVNVITRQPNTERPELDVNVRLADFDERVGSIYASAPLGDKVAGGLSLFSIQRDGYIRNVATGRMVGDDDTQGGRLKLLFQPGGTWRITLAADALKDNSVAPSPRETIGPFASGPFTTNVDVEPVSRRDIGGVSSTVEVDVLGGHRLTSITAYRWANNDRSSDSDGSPDPFQVTRQESDQTQFSQELRLVSPAGGRFDYVVGLFYFDQSIFGRTTGTIIPFATSASIFGDIDTKSFAVFGNADYHLTDALTLNAGLRYTKEDKDLAYRQVGSGPFSFLVPSIGLAPDSLSDDDVSPTLGLRYKPNENATLYVTASRGYRSGGWNVEPQTSATITSWTQVRFGSESLTSLEVGAKTSWFDDRLFVNLAAFDISYDDLQVATRVPLPAPFAPGTFASVVANAATASAHGAELEVLARPTDALTLGGNVGVVDTKYDKYVQPGTPPLSFTGKELNGAPDLTVGAFAEYIFKLGDVGDLTARLDYRHVAEYFTDRSNNPFNATPSSDVLNARLTYDGSNKRFRAAVFANNVTDETIIATRVGFPGITENIDYARPRVVGVEFGYRY